MTLRPRPSLKDASLSRREAHKVALGVGLSAALGCDKNASPTVDAGDAAIDTTAPDAAICIDREPAETRVFMHGVASGDPQSDRVILWTRVSTFRTTQNVMWEIASDSAFATRVANGSAEAKAEHDFTVKVDATGLMPGTTYYYRFQLGADTSPIGRTRTAPIARTRLRFAVVTCSNYNHGYFHLYRSIAEQADLDAVIHLGDYIYEYANIGCGQAYAVAPAGGSVRDTEPAHEIVTLADYRRRYAHYRTDADLQEVHRQHPFIVTWDDHEIANNSNRQNAANHQADEGDYSVRKAAAAQAYFEWLPIRAFDGTRLYRSFVYGDMAELIVLDTRIEGRDPQATQAVDPQPSSCACPDLNSPDRRMISAAQEAFLLERLSQSAARYRVICQQVVFGQLKPIFSSNDAWDGYPEARRRVLAALATANTSIVLTGDMHAALALDLPNDPYDAAQYNSTTRAGSHAVEFVMPSITSFGFDDQVAANVYPAMLRERAPHVRFLDFVRRGYGVLDLDVDSAELNYRFTESVSSPTRSAEVAGEIWSVRSGERFLRGVDSPRPARTNTAPLAP